MDEVARRAKVGICTLYRRFPTREGLLAAASNQRRDAPVSWRACDKHQRLTKPSFFAWDCNPARNAWLYCYHRGRAAPARLGQQAGITRETTAHRRCA
ncbi:helix-turn-helix domain-containing protein [Tardiphaga sp. 866_E4_N2_1]|uniref:helix-turn-helix domain-containing protein n=1 Tax=unclassified Tardiphaga TaxID=2631404 RepID=UPI003F2549D1